MPGNQSAWTSGELKAAGGYASLPSTPTVQIPVLSPEGWQKSGHRVHPEDPGGVRTLCRVWVRTAHWEAEKLLKPPWHSFPIPCPSISPVPAGSKEYPSPLAVLLGNKQNLCPGEMDDSGKRDLLPTAPCRLTLCPASPAHLPLQVAYPGQAQRHAPRTSLFVLESVQVSSRPGEEEAWREAENQQSSPPKASLRLFVIVASTTFWLLLIVRV